MTLVPRREPIRHHRGKGLVELEQSEASVIARFSDGSQTRGDLLVGADGIRSTVRQQLLPDLAPLYRARVERLARQLRMLHDAVDRWATQGARTDGEAREPTAARDARRVPV